MSIVQRTSLCLLRLQAFPRGSVVISSLLTLSRVGLSTSSGLRCSDNKIPLTSSSSSASPLRTFQASTTSSSSQLRRSTFYGLHQLKRQFSTSIEEQLFESGEEIERLWEAKVNSFKKIMLRLPKETKWHTMLEKNEVVGVGSETDNPIAKATCKILCVFWRTQKTCSMGWAAGLPKPTMHIDRESLPKSWKLPGVVPVQNEHEASLIALILTDHIAADHLFIVPLPHAVVFLGLSSVELGDALKNVPKEKQEEFIPHSYVIRVLDAIQLEAIRTISLVEDAINSGQTEKADHLTIVTMIQNYASTLEQLASTTYPKHNKYLTSLAIQLKKHAFDVQTAEPMKIAKALRGVSSAIVILKRVWDDSIPKTIQ